MRKRILALILTVFCAFALFGCAKNEDSSKKGPVQNSEDGWTGFY